MTDPLALASPGAVPAVVCGAALLCVGVLAIVALGIGRRNGASFASARGRIYISAVVLSALAIGALAARVTLTPYRVRVILKGDSLVVEDGWRRRTISALELSDSRLDGKSVVRDSLLRNMAREEGIEVTGCLGGWFRLSDDSRALVALTRRDRPYVLYAFGNRPSLVVSPADTTAFFTFFYSIADSRGTRDPEETTRFRTAFCAAPNRLKIRSRRRPTARAS